MKLLGTSEDAMVEILVDETTYVLPVKMRMDLNDGVALVFNREGEYGAMSWGNWARVRVKS